MRSNASAESRAGKIRAGSLRRKNVCGIAYWNLYLNFFVGKKIKADSRVKKLNHGVNCDAGFTISTKEFFSVWMMGKYHYADRYSTK